ncbi:ferritin family protein [Oscillibacter sp. MSJ-31]|uniref:ferritin family protein n=1 Tax=Oscillibacter sp. MSJ-31 TaxID=2841526 RepID=UPI001C1223BE|nr:ferritin-like domain-containing protein [Oscillibacter sp. MSJ-31]MBU5457322.1 ferritin-like domain-containing protein [Oscillibacter sp. MSJ-31]
MENELSAAQNAAYDYRRCARVWQRVDPTLDPYPDVRAAAAMAADTPGDGLSAAERNAELTLPGAQADPCCMGTAALESLEVLQGFIREELADRRTYLFLARRAPTAEARQVFRAIASDEGRHARRLLAAVYLITGERYCPAICYPPLRCDGYCAALRERYHEEVCGGFNYRRASQETLDPCLQQLLLAFSQDEYRHANAMLCLLSGVM